jgi:4-aminobutyrate aminotransferase/(S)-3-amino-2-methylpropionate transaminase
MTPSFPVFWQAAKGTNVLDMDGNVYLDLTGAFGVSVAGHGHPAVVEEIRVQSRELVHGMGDVHPPARKVELMEALSRLVPWSDVRIILGSSGSESVEAALKTALLATEKPGIVAFEGAYHGLTLGSLAATARKLFREPFEHRLYSGVRFISFPDPSRMGGGAGERSLEALATALKEGVAGHQVGAIIVEPIQGRAGVRIPPAGFLAEVARLTREHGALLIFDEIFTGLGRTGSLFAFQEEAVTPDLLCLGKGLGGGLPLSACLGPGRVMDAWPASGGEAIHTSTFLGHPLACAAGSALLRTLVGEGLPERSAVLGAHLLRVLREGLGDLKGVLDVRGRGLFLGIELADPDTLEPTFGAAVAMAEEALKRGILVLPAGQEGHVLEISPPLTITEEQVDWVGPELVDLVVATLRSPRPRPR